MSTDLVGVLYNATSKVVRAIIIPEKGDGLEDANILAQQQKPPVSCAVATIPLATLTDTRLVTVIAAINQQQKLGLQFPQICALADQQGIVQNAVIADPVHTPKLNGLTVIANSVGAGNGDTWDGVNFNRKYAVYQKNSGLVTSTPILPLPTAPTVTANQKVAVNNDSSLSVGSIVGVVAVQL